MTSTLQTLMVCVAWFHADIGMAWLACDFHGFFLLVVLLILGVECVPFHSDCSVKIVRPQFSRHKFYYVQETRTYHSLEFFVKTIGR